jgi:peptidoglycan hydrolase-like protein with peptidoglycan-binding domain/3D (Asp-Asp-Asp) domain-containing protein
VLLKAKILVILGTIFVFCFQSVGLAAGRDTVYKIGMQGYGVKEIQEYLHEADLYNGEVNGVFEASTGEAVKKFQRLANLEPDGIVGPHVLNALQNYQHIQSYVKQYGQPETEDDVQLNVILRYGIRGEDVKIVQYYLKKAGFYNDNIDGAFGDGTLQAVKAFQQSANLVPDGKVGGQTFKALKEYKALATPVSAATPVTVVSPKNEITTLAIEPVHNGVVSATNNSPQMTSKETKVVKKDLIKTKQSDTASTIKQDGATLQRSDSDGINTQMPQKNAEVGAHNLTTFIGLPANWYPIRLEATAYTRYDEGCTDYTYRGNYLRTGMVAVDPKVIPLGTRLFIPGYGYGIADDIGGAIQGYRIDLAMDTLAEAYAYGRRHITVYIIDWAATV